MSSTGTGPRPFMADTPPQTSSRMPAALPHRRRIWPWLLPLCLVAAVSTAVWALSEEYTIEVGPFDLPTGGHEQMQQPAPLAVALPVDGWLHGISFDLVDRNGQVLPSGALHHLNLIQPEHRELFSQIMLRVGAAGSETKPYAIPWFLGYRVHPGDSLLVVSMVHNPTPRAYQGVRVRVKLRLTRATPWFRPIAIKPLYVDVMPPAGVHAFDLPPGHSVKSWEGRPAVAARLLAAGGHLHPYSIALRFEDATTGELIWEARPKVGTRGELLGMPTKYFLPFGVPLLPDHVYRLSAEYDNPTGKVLEDGGMGALGGVVVPTSDLPWPTVARADSEYRKDVRVVMGQEPSAHGHMHHDMNMSMPRP